MNRKNILASPRAALRVAAMAAGLAAGLALALASCTGADTELIGTDDDAGTSGSSSGSSGSSSGSTGGTVSSDSGTYTCPEFSAGDILATEEHLDANWTREEGFYTYTEIDYYRFTSGTYAVKYEYSSDRPSENSSSAYTYAPGTGKLMNASSSSDNDSYIWQINGGLYKVGSGAFARQSGSGLFATFSGSTDDGTLTATVSFTAAGTFTLTYSDTGSEPGSSTISGLYTNSSGILKTGSDVTVDSDLDYAVELLTSMAKDAALFFYDGTAIYLIDHTLTRVSSLPSAVSGL